MNIPKIDFEPFPKIPRLSREMVVTEKIDGTNATIYVNENGDVFAASRTRWLTDKDDNYGFAAWVKIHRDELSLLGPGWHRGEWWGQGIQRGYGLKEKRFSLFNVARWLDDAVRPDCCHVVPTIYQGPFNTNTVDLELDLLRENGSYAAPGFDRPEGIVVFHVAGNFGFKKTLEKDNQPKSICL